VDKSLVKNAASSKQVKNAERVEKLAEKNHVNDLKVVLDSAEGRRVAWRLLSHCGLFSSPYAHSGSEQNRNIGRSDVGRWFLSEILEVDEKLWLQMQSENMGKGDVHV